MNVDWIRKFDAHLAVKGTVILLIATYGISQYPHYPPFPELTSALTAGLLMLVGLTTYSYSHFLIVNGLPAMDVSAECSGIMLLMLFPLIIFLIPDVKLYQRAASFFFLPVLFFGNILRITIDAIVGVHYGTDALSFFHDTFGQIFVFFWVIALYVVWLRIFNNFPREERMIHPSGYD